MMNTLNGNSGLGFSTHFRLGGNEWHSNKTAMTVRIARNPIPLSANVVCSYFKMLRFL